MPYRDYEFRDLVTHSGANRNEVTTWVQRGAIPPRIGDTSGTGVRRRFDFFNVFESCIAQKLNMLPGGIPSRQLTLALDAVRLHAPGRSAQGRADRGRDQLATLSNADAAEATVLGFALACAPLGPQRFEDFLTPETRDADARFWLVWSPRLGFGELVDSKPLLDALLADLDILVVVNLHGLLTDLEQRTHDHWVRPAVTLDAPTGKPKRDSKRR